MKKAILLVAFVAALITAGYTCNWFDSRSGSPKDPFIGKWKIDSVQTPDSSSIGHLLVAMTFDDSATHHIEFSEDSITIFTKEDVEKSDWKVDEKAKQLFFNKGDTAVYAFLAGNSLRLMGRDSTALFLVKK